MFATAAAALGRDLCPGEMYRISYAMGGPAQRRVSRSLVRFDGQTEKRQWDGGLVQCLDFVRPQGRSLSLLASQLVDVRAATFNECGQLVLIEGASGNRRRLARRRRPQRVA